jgi:integrase
VTFHVREKDGKPRRNRDGSLSILTLVRVPKFKRVSQTFKTQQEAEAWAVPLVKELTDQGRRGVRPDLPSLTIGALTKEYFDDPGIEALKSSNGYAARAKFWIENYGPTKVLDFGVSSLRDARDKLKTGERRKQRSAASINRHLSVMRGIWNWGRSAGWIPLERHWPTRLLLPEPAGRNRFLNSTELDGLLKAAEADPLMKAAILVSVATGLRQGELLRLKWTDVDFENGWVTIHVSKNKTPRRVHLTSQAAAALKALQPAKDGGPIWVFVLDSGQPLKQSYLEVRWRRIRAAAGLVDFRWHDLRHSCASYLAQNGATLLEIGSVLGHKSPNMTMRYAHLIQGAAVTGHSALDDMLKGK